MATPIFLISHTLATDWKMQTAVTFWPDVPIVSICGKDSYPLGITSGVPQGSVLGPLLFLLFISNLPNASKHLKFYVFADDTNLYYDSGTLDDVIKRVNKGLKHVKRWLDSNRLSFNISKTSYIIFHSSASSVPTDTSIKIGKKQISRVKYIKFLGVLLDEHFDGRYHIATFKKACKNLWNIFKDQVSTSNSHFDHT